MAQQEWIQAALLEARQGMQEGGIPIGSVLADAAGNIVARGHNLRVQTGDPTAHAEVVCIRNADGAAIGLTSRWSARSVLASCAAAPAFCLEFLALWWEKIETSLARKICFGNAR